MYSGGVVGGGSGWRGDGGSAIDVVKGTSWVLLLLRAGCIFQRSVYLIAWQAVKVGVV